MGVKRSQSESNLKTGKEFNPKNTIATQFFNMLSIFFTFLFTKKETYPIPTKIKDQLENIDLTKEERREIKTEVLTALKNEEVKEPMPNKLAVNGFPAGPAGWAHKQQSLNFLPGLGYALRLS